MHRPTCGYLWRGDHVADASIARVYQHLLVDDDRESKQYRQQPAVPAELLLQHGMHLVLVFQREGETIALPSGNNLQLLYSVHDVCAGAVLSASGVFCSQKHLIETLQRRAAVSEGPAAYQSSETEQHIIALPVGVFKSSPLAQPLMLTKPSVPALQRVGQAMGITGPQYGSRVSQPDALPPGSVVGRSRPQESSPASQTPASTAASMPTACFE